MEYALFHMFACVPVMVWGKEYINNGKLFSAAWS